MEEQGTTTREIAHNVAEAAKGTAEVATNITDVSRAANETGSGSVQVLSSARSLVRQSDRLKKEVAKFLNSVRGNRPHALFNLVPRCQGKLHSSAPRHTAAGPDCRQPKVSYRRCKN
jgi:hypothetical protein